MPNLVRPLACGVVLGAALLLAPSYAAAQQVRIVQGTADQRTDSLVDRIFKAKVEEVHRIVAEWRERDGRIAASLNALPPDGGDVLVRRRLNEEFMQSSREAFAMLRAVQERCQVERGPVPDGYIGVSLDMQVDVVEGRRTASRVFVSSVEPGGPAQRAGVQRDDRLLAIGGRDASAEIPEISDLLVPGRTVTIRVDRAGVPREMTVRIEPRPKDFAQSCGEFERSLMPLRVRSFAQIPRERSPMPATGSARVEVGTTERMRTSSPDELSVFVFGPGPMSEGFFAGAKFRSLDDDWRETLGVREGVLVMNVAAGSLAARAGLKGGDVVTAVGTEPATDVLVFIRLLNVAERREATLEVSRERKSRTVTLRWGQQP